MTIVINFLNLHGYFIGFELAGLSGWTTIDMDFLQVAAKLQELLIVASLATAVSRKVRQELLKEDGLPQVPQERPFFSSRCDFISCGISRRYYM